MGPNERRACELSEELHARPSFHDEGDVAGGIARIMAFVHAAARDDSANDDDYGGMTQQLGADSAGHATAPVKGKTRHATAPVERKTYFEQYDIVAALDYDAETWHAEQMMAALVDQHGHRWTNKIACAAWDSMNVVQVMETRRSRNRYVRYLLAIITRSEIEHKFMLLVCYINTHHNHPSDDLKSFALPAEAEDPNTLAHQLAQARVVQDPWAGAVAASRPSPRMGPGVAAVVELRAGPGQISGAAGALGGRVHGLVEADPVARQLLQMRFLGAQVRANFWVPEEWPPVTEAHLIVLATVAAAAAAGDMAGALRHLSCFATPSVVAVAVVDPEAWELPLASLRQAAAAGGCQLVSRARLCASEWGAANCQEIEILEFAATGASADEADTGHIPPLVVRGRLAARGDRPATLVTVLSAPSAVPPGCVLEGSLAIRKSPRGSPFALVRVGTITLRGAAATLFRGALVQLSGSGSDGQKKCRLKYREGAEGLLELTSVGGRTTVKVGPNRVRHHLTQRGAVVSIDGVGELPVAASAAPGGAGNNLILDYRIGPQAVRPLLSDECFRLQGHSEAGRAAVEHLVPNDDQRQAGLAGRGVAEALAAEVARRAAIAVARDATAPGDRCGGGKQTHTTASIRLGSRGDAALAEAEAELFRSQLADGSRLVYDRGFRYWAIWRAWRERDPFLRGGAVNFEDENELIKFVSHFGVVCQYAYPTVHGWLHGIQHAHILNGLSDPFEGKLRLRIVRKGHKRWDRRRRGPTRKLAVTVDLILELIMHEGLDFNKWDDAVLGAAIAFGFSKLRRSGEFLRKGAAPNAEHCVRVGDITMAKDGVAVKLTPEEVLDADEVIAMQRKSRADQDWSGSETNTFLMSDARLCVVSWVKHLVNLRPAHSADPKSSLFTLSDGRVRNRDSVSGALKSAGRRMGLKESEIDVISLRAGGGGVRHVPRWLHGRGDPAALSVGERLLEAVRARGPDQGQGHGGAHGQGGLQALLEREQW